MVIAEAGHSGNGAGSVLSAVEADKGKALGKGRKKSIQGTARQMTPPHHGRQPTLDWPVVLSFAK